MEARKRAAAVSAAGILLIAGCSGGGRSGGTSLPSVPNSGGQSTSAPASSSKVSFALAIPARKAMAWAKPFYVPAAKASKRTPKSRAKTTVAASALFGKKTPQSLSEGLVGGSISIYIYQGTSLALTQGPFTVGLTYGAYNFYCSYVPALGQYACVNQTPVFAPYGNDTFFVATYSAGHQLLSITPGMPGTSFSGPAQTPYTITASGYPYPIGVSTYPVAGNFAVDAPTSCVDPSGGTGVADTGVVDNGGFEIPPGSYLANPVTVTTTGGWSLWSENVDGPVATPYTIYNTYDYFELVATSDGASGAVSVSALGAPSLINGLTSSMNLYAVDRLAMSPSSSGISVMGLADSGPAAFTCGTLPIADVNGNAVAISNPVSIAGDDWFPGVAVLENASGAPYVQAVDVGRFSFGFDFEPFIPALPTIGVQLAGSGPLEMAVSPYEYGSGNIYVLNSDGSIQLVNENSGTTATITEYGVIPGPVGIDVLWDGEGSDTVFATSSTMQSLYGVFNANSSPSSSWWSINSLTLSSFGSPSTSAVFADNITGMDYLSFLIFDSSNNSQSVAVCTTNDGIECAYTQFATGSAQSAGMLSEVWPSGSGTPYFLAASGDSVLTFTNTASELSPFVTLGNPVTRIITAYDGLWNGVGAGGVFKFFYNDGAQAGTLTGTRAVIVSPQSQYE